MKKIFSLLALLMLLGTCSAHQPRITFGEFHPKGNPVIVTHPEISQAFYGDLSGQSDYYQITSDTWFLLYASIVVPDLTGSRTDFVLGILQGNVRLEKWEGSRLQRSGFYEKFAGDEYLQWPLWERQVGSGVYTIIISNPGNQGKYSLAIGKIESFPLNEIIKTLKVLPILKTQFFDTSARAIFQWLIVQMITGTFIILLLLILAIIFLIRRKNGRK